MTGRGKEAKGDKIKEIEEIGEIIIEEIKMKSVDNKLLPDVIEKVNIK